MDSLLLNQDRQALVDMTQFLPARGEIMICGTYQGGDVKLFRKACPSRRITVIDSFAGLADPTDQDEGSPHQAGDFSCSLEDYHRFLAGEKVRPPEEIHEMWITEENLKKVVRRSIALLWLDLDFYQPTMDCMRRFWDWVEPGGFMAVHDVGFDNCPGVTRACVDFGGAWNHIGFVIGVCRKPGV
jgi:hypothetical protein